VVLAYNGGGNAVASAEVERFRQTRRPLRPGTVQVYFVVHEASA